MEKFDITTLDQLNEIDKNSINTSQLIYKHSTTCTLSEGVWNDLKKSDLKINYLDLLAYRNISNEIESRYNVRHESPQVLIIKNGKCTYHESHWRIEVERIKKEL